MLTYEASSQPPIFNCVSDINHGKHWESRTVGIGMVGMAIPVFEGEKYTMEAVLWSTSTTCSNSLCTCSSQPRWQLFRVAERMSWKVSLICEIMHEKFPCFTQIRIICYTWPALWKCYTFGIGLQPPSTVLSSATTGMMATCMMAMPVWDSWEVIVLQIFCAEM